MLKRIGHLVRRLIRSRGGNATMMVALGLPALIGAMGYGVDTAQWYMWQRELQHSVDQAAIGGAWAMAYDEPGNYRTRAQQEFYANQNVTADFDSAPTIQLANFDGGTNNSVLVTASVTRELPFTSLLLNHAATISARAQARFEEGARFTACLVTLKEGEKVFQIGGNATVIANCGLAALSCSKNAIEIDANAKVETTSIATCGTASVPEELESTVSEGVTVTDRYKDVPIPEPDPSLEQKTKTNYCKGGKNTIALLEPAIYVGGYTANCNTTFAPGVYFIDGGTLDLSTNATVVANNVLFVLRNGAEIKLGGQGQDTNSVTLTPMGVDTESLLEKYTSYSGSADQFSQMLFLEEKGDGTDTASHQINGNTNLSIQGILYLPNGDVRVNGTSDTKSELCFQISAYTLNILGDAYLKTLCKADETGEVGSKASIVRLVV